MVSMRANPHAVPVATTDDMLNRGCQAAVRTPISGGHADVEVFSSGVSPGAGPLLRAFALTSYVIRRCNGDKNFSVKS